MSNSFVNGSLWIVVRGPNNQGDLAAAVSDHQGHLFDAQTHNRVGTLDMSTGAITLGPEFGARLLAGAAALRSKT